MKKPPKLSTAPIGDDEFYLWMGKCINLWADVDQQLFLLCHHALGTSHECAAIVYYRSPTPELRLSLVDELLKTCMPRRIKKNGGHDARIVKQWRSIRKKITEYKLIRNSMAHHPYREHLTPGLEGDKITTMVAYKGINKDHFELLRPASADLDTIQGEDLIKHYAAVSKLIDELFEFFSALNLVLTEEILPNTIPNQTAPSPKQRGARGEEPPFPPRLSRG